MLIVSMVIAAIYLLMSLAFFFSSRKFTGRDQVELLLLGAVLAVGAVILTVSGLTVNVRLLITGIVSPIGLVFVVSSAFSLDSCRRCTCETAATCVGLVPTAKGSSGTCCPRFKYSYNEETYESTSLSTYRMREAKRLYSVGAEYTVYIDPDHPRNCVCDVKRSCARHIFIIALNSVITLVGLVALVL